ncbi:MAG: endonuclease V [Candidatus Helarchaeota archaeon]
MKPIFISIGHKISLMTALEVTKKSIKNEKLPIPLTEAHKLANELKSKTK